MESQMQHWTFKKKDEIYYTDKNSLRDCYLFWFTKEKLVIIPW